MSKPKIFFLVPYPNGKAPSQRFRFEQYVELLAQNGFKVTHLSFLNQFAWKILYSNQSIRKGWSLVKAFALRPFQILTLWNAEFVFIHREAAPFGPPIFEWFIANLLGKKIIYDFDDSIWLTDKLDESLITKAIRWRRKVSSICQWSYKISCGNSYLGSYASAFNRRVIINPTTIDTEFIHNPSLYEVRKEPGKIIIGWTGSHSTLKYLYLLENVLKKTIGQFNNVFLLVIADSAPQLNLEHLIFKPWSKESEIKDLLLSDIGIMPLPDDEWSKGKCGFKALQYMALEIPAIASPVGVNTQIIQHGQNGFLCSTEEEWIVTLEKLIMNINLRRQIGLAGRKTVVDHYSVSSNADNFLSLFK